MEEREKEEGEEESGGGENDEEENGADDEEEEGKGYGDGERSSAVLCVYGGEERGCPNSLRPYLLQELQ